MSEGNDIEGDVLKNPHADAERVRNVEAEDLAAPRGGAASGAEESAAGETEGKEALSENGANAASGEPFAGDVQKMQAPMPLFLADTPLGEPEARVLADSVAGKKSALLAGGVFVICAALSLVLGFLDGDMIYGICLLSIGAIAAVLLAFLFPVLARKNTIKSLVYKNAVTRAAVFEDRLEYSAWENGRQVSYNVLPVYGIKKVVRFRSYILIWVNNLQALIVSDSGFLIGNADAFLSFCRARGLIVTGKEKG